MGVETFIALLVVLFGGDLLLYGLVFLLTGGFSE